MIPASKKAQIGKTITWIVGFLIIFFIMFIFISFSALLAGTKEVASEIEKTATLEIFRSEDYIAYSSSTAARQSLIAALNTPVSEEVQTTLLDRILSAQSNDASVKESAEKILDELCRAYVFSAGELKIDKSEKESSSSFGAEAALNLSSKGKVLEIKYKQLREC